MSTEPVDRTDPKLLIFRLGSIGDTVVALPCFHAVARAFPDHRRVLLTNPTAALRASSAETVLGGAGLIHEALYYPLGLKLSQSVSLVRELRRHRFDTLVYLADRPQTLSVYRDLAFFKAAGIARVIGTKWPIGLRRSQADPLTGELEPEPERLARIMAPQLAVDLSPASWDLRLSEAEHAAARRRFLHAAPGSAVIAMAPGAKVARKDWGEHNWQALLGILHARRPALSLVMVGAADERSLADRLQKVWSGPFVNACGELTPRETAALLSRCSMLVCHDSGPMHLAASQGTPCVALFGDYNRPRRWFPYGPDHRVLHEPRGVRLIVPERVADAIEAVLLGARADRANALQERRGRALRHHRY